MDVLTPEQRRRCMAAIRSKNTKPERIVKQLLRQMGFRLRLHAAALPGKPDIVIPSGKFAVFVHGCFWHSHRCRYGTVVPSTNRIFWRRKRADTINRDRRNVRQLRAMGWLVVTVWECWTRTPEKLLATLQKLLGFKGRETRHNC